MADESKSGGQTTLVAPSDTGAGRGDFLAALVPALTVVHHPDPDRVGGVALLGQGAPVALSRLEPAFAPPRTARAVALADPYVSRKPLYLARDGTGGVTLKPAEGSSRVRLDGQDVRQATSVGVDQLSRGAVVQLAGRVVLVLHLAAVKPSETDPLGLVGESAAIARVRDEILRVADLDGPGLLRGESGVGKELVAQAVHASSGRSGGPLVTVNMGAIPPTTAASELFGHVKGAFTGAASARKGMFEQADGGTLFLDEIGETPPEVQVMLLRALENGEIQRVGSDRPHSVDVRLVAATDQDLEAAVEEGRFRAPLFHRLAGFQVAIPPLRERREDIGRLLHSFLLRELAAAGEDTEVLARPLEEDLWLSAGLAERLARFDWPGNVRQLSNVARQIVISSRGQEGASLPPAVDALIFGARDKEPAPSAGASVASTEGATGERVRPEDIGEDLLVDTLRANRWRVGATAKSFGISRTSLYGLMEKCGRVRKARDLTAEDIATARDSSGDVLADAAELLEVSERGLRLRMKELGVS